MRNDMEQYLTDGIINYKALFEFLAILPGDDGKQLMEMSFKYRNALKVDQITFATVNAGGIDSYIHEKGQVLSKKLLWLNWKCKETVGKSFLKKRIDKNKIESMIQLADEFINYIEVGFE